MNDILKTYMERFRENRHTLRRYTAFVLALAMITTLFVNWQLHGVGISMTAQYQCGEEEHTHTADCYTKVLICGYEEGELENADEVAAAAATSQPTVEAEPAPLALEPQIEFVPHEHTEDCYTEVQTLTCMEEEHVHGDDCFDPEDGTLICEKFEHTHDENCYTTEYELTCGLEEGELVEQVVEPTQSAELAAMAVAEPVALEPTVDTVEPIYHHHTDACYEEVLTCPLPEHHHTVACLSDTSADVETPEEWQAANDEAVMTGNWDEDLLSVAKTQLGYEQSEKNFEIDPADGVTLHYYSRYGQSYGNPYGEWDVMFLSYCLKYAGIPQSAIPQEASVLSLRSSMSDMDWLLDGEDGSAAQPGDIVIYNKYVTRTVAVDSSADSAEPDLDDLFSVDTEFENSAELEDSGVSALDAAPSADDSAVDPGTDTQDTVAAPSADTQDTVLTPDTVDPQPEQPAEKPVDSADTAAPSTVTSVSGADALAPSVVSPAAEPQTTTVTDALPVETVGIVSEADDDTLTVISGDVDGKVAEVTLSSAEVLAVVDVAAAQYADEMLSSAVDGALKAPDMLTLAGEPMTVSTTTVGSALDGTNYVTDFKIQKQQGSQYVDVATSVVTDQMHGYLELKDIPAQDIASHDYKVKVALPEAFDLQSVASETGDLIDPNYTGPKGSVCGTYQFVKENGKWYVLFTYDRDFIHQDQVSNTTKVRSTVNFDFRWDQTKVTTGGSNEFKVNEKAKVTIYIKREESTTPGEEKKFSLDKQSAGLKYDGKNAYVDYTVKLTLKEDRAAPLTLTDTLTSPSGVTFNYVEDSLKVTGPDSSAPTISWANTADGKTITLGTSGTLQKGIYTITYRVKADNFGSTSYNGDYLKNFIKFGDDVEGTSTSIKTKDIEKSGKLSKDGEIITWTVKINNGDVMRYLPSNAKFTDTIDTDQEFVAGSFKVTKTDADSNETKTKPTDVYNSTDHKLTYNLEPGFNKYEITYQTKVTKAIPLTGLDVKNTGNLEGDGLDSSSEGTVHIDSDVLTKEAVGEPTNNGTEATMQWKSTIKPTNVSSYIYYDYSGTVQEDATGKKCKAQEIDLASIVVKDKDGNSVSVTPVAWKSGETDDYGTDLGLFKIDFTDITAPGPMTITYTTKCFIVQQLPSYGATVKNHCRINNGTVATAEQKITKGSDTISYFYKYAGDCNWTNIQSGSGSTTLQPGQKLPWTIELNAEGVLKWENDTKWVITDTIPRGLVLDESSVQIKNYGVALPATSTVTKNADGTTTLVITMLPESFRYTNNSVTEIRKQINITYDTTLDPKCTDIWNDNTASFKNVAKFERNGHKIGDTSFTETVTRRVVGKSGTFDETTGLLTYQVKLNPYGATLNNGTDMDLQDVMTVPSDLWADGSGNKRVTLEGISVFDAKLQADGTLEATTWRADLTCVAGNNVDTSTYYFKYSSDNSHQLKAWTKVPDSTPLVLVFHYRVNTEGLVKGNAFTFENTATLNGKWKNEQCNTSFTSSSGATAGIDFNSNRLTIVKYSGTPDKVLPGAKFSLEKYNATTGWKSEKTDIVTNTSGNVTLGSLDVNTFYRLKETQAPDGYRTPNNYHYFVISDNSSYTASGVPDYIAGTDTFSEYKLAEGQKFGSFYYYCENTPNDNSDYVLPSTGGTGTFPYTAVGGTMMLSALAYSIIHRKRRREGRVDD